jgi:hypothetical protein
MRIIIIDDFPPTDFISAITDEDGNTKVFDNLADAQREADELQNGKMFDLDDPLNSIQREKIKTRILSIKRLIKVDTTQILTKKEVDNIYDNLDYIYHELTT